MELKKNKKPSKKHVAPAPKIELAYDVLFPSQKKRKMRKPNQRSKPKPVKMTVNRQQQTVNQCVWRKTIVLTKTKPKHKLPRLFRADRKTGLPVDYERTVSKIMHYVNPHLSTGPSPDQLMEEQLTRTLVGYVGNWTCKNRCPQSIKHQMRVILRNQGSPSLKKDIRNDEDLSQFHCACKRKPSLPETLFPTYNSKFNYNNLKIKSK